MGRHDIEHEVAVKIAAERSTRTCVVLKANVPQPIAEGGVARIVCSYDHVHIVCGSNKSRAFVRHKKIERGSTDEDDLWQQRL